MSVFSSEQLLEKLSTLTSSQHSIEMVSGWCTFHRKHAKQIVILWNDDFSGSSLKKQLSLLYLANDILHGSRKHGTEYRDAFFRVLPKAMGHVVKNGDNNAGDFVRRLGAIWKERRIFVPAMQKTIEDAILNVSICLLYSLAVGTRSLDLLNWLYHVPLWLFYLPRPFLYFWYFNRLVYILVGLQCALGWAPDGRSWSTWRLCTAGGKGSLCTFASTAEPGELAGCSFFQILLLPGLGFEHSDNEDHRLFAWYSLL